MCDHSLWNPQQWSRSRVLFCAFAVRVTLIIYSHIHDYVFRVNFTDIDYSVFSDAAVHVYNGGSPFERLTYRYTPALAWILLPVNYFPDFGKYLFCIFDILVAYLCLELLDARDRKNESSHIRSVVIFWLANPMTAIISARGNAESIVSAGVVLSLWLLEKGYWKTSALAHGALAVHFKIYPIIYLPSIFLFLSDWNSSNGYFEKVKAFVTNWKGYLYALISVGTFSLITYGFYQIYGDLFLNEFLLYHITRRDIRHNFSPYFYPLYLAEGDENYSKLIGFGAFLPQVATMVFYAFKYHDNLPFCWFLTTFAFVAFNKVCTSQYFIWYIVFLPLIADQIKMSTTRTLVLTCLWFLGQGLWLLPAYLFEFQGWNTLIHMFFASLAFLMINCIILSQVQTYYVGNDVKKQKNE